MTVNSLYEVLGAKPDDDAAAIRRAFIAAARRHHPDRHAIEDVAARAEAEDRMRAINEAWAVLGDAQRRAAYDRSIARGSATGVAPVTQRPAAHEPSSGVTAPRWMTVLPPALILAAIACLAVGFVTGLVGLLALGLACALAAAAAFILVPVVTMMRSRDDENGG